MLTPLELNLLPFATPRVENRVAQVRIFPSHLQINQLKHNQDSIRFVKNALLGAVKVLHFNLHNLHGPQKLTDTKRFYLGKLDDVKAELERIKNHHRVKIAEKLHLAKKLEDRKKIQDQQEKAEQSWQTYPVILDVMLFNKLLLWLKEEYVFLQAADSQALIKAARETLDSLKKFTQGKRGYPRFKSKKTYFPRIYFPNAKIADGKLILPKFNLPIRLRGTKYDLDQTKSVDVICRNGKWIANILLQRKLEREPSSISHKLGLDLGVKHTVTTSDGRHFDLPFDKLAKLDKLKRKYQRKKAKAIRQSKSYYRYLTLIAKMSRKIANVRLDWQRKLIHLLVVRE